MICKVCNYDDSKNKDETDWEFWVSMDSIHFKRQEFTDEVELLEVNLIMCPKCHSINEIPKDKIKKISTDDFEEDQNGL